MRNHTLKCWPSFFEDIVSGCKTVELRKNDRNFEVGDTLTLHEFSPGTCEYSGRTYRCVVTHICRGEQWLKPGVVALSIKAVSE